MLLQEFIDSIESMELLDPEHQNNSYLEVFSVILVNNSQKDTDKYIHANNNKDDEKDAIPIVQIVGWNPKMREKTD